MIYSSYRIIQVLVVCVVIRACRNLATLIMSVAKNHFSQLSSLRLAAEDLDCVFWYNRIYLELVHVNRLPGFCAKVQVLGYPSWPPYVCTFASDAYIIPRRDKLGSLSRWFSYYIRHLLQLWPAVNWQLLASLLYVLQKDVVAWKLEAVVTLLLKKATDRIKMHIFTQSLLDLLVKVHLSVMAASISNVGVISGWIVLGILEFLFVRLLIVPWWKRHLSQCIVVRFFLSNGILSVYCRSTVCIIALLDKRLVMLVYVTWRIVPIQWRTSLSHCRRRCVVKSWFPLWLKDLSQGMRYSSTETFRRRAGCVEWGSAC